MTLDITRLLTSKVEKTHVKRKDSMADEQPIEDAAAAAPGQPEAAEGEGQVTALELDSDDLAPSREGAIGRKPPSFLVGPAFRYLPLLRPFCRLAHLARRLRHLLVSQRASDGRISASAFGAPRGKRTPTEFTIPPDLSRMVSLRWIPKAM